MMDMLVLNRRNRNRGFVLVNLPVGAGPDELFGAPAVPDPFARYADVGLERPRRKRAGAGESRLSESGGDSEGSEGPEWLKEDVEIDEEEWA